MRKERNAHKRSTYAKVSKDQAEIDKYLKEYGARQAVNSGKVFSFNNVEIGKGSMRDDR